MATLQEHADDLPDAINALKPEHFLGFYEDLIAELGSEELNILEVGVLRGGTILAFAKRLPKARILGIDINEPPKLFWEEVERTGASDRIAIRLGSQTDRDFLRRAIRETFGDEKLDLVTDDALHSYKGARPTFEEIFMPHVREGGVYVIEDWGAGYFIESADGHPDGRHGLVRLVKQLIDQVALPDRTVEWKGHRSLRNTNRQMAAPIEKAVITNGLAAFFRGPGEWLAPLDGGPRIDERTIRRDVERYAKSVAKRILR